MLDERWHDFQGSCTYKQGNVARFYDERNHRVLTIPIDFINAPFQNEQKCSFEYQSQFHETATAVRNFKTNIA